MLQSPIRSISEPEFAYPAYLVLCPNRDPYIYILTGPGADRCVHRDSLSTFQPSHTRNKLCGIHVVCLVVHLYIKVMGF